MADDGDIALEKEEEEEESTRKGLLSSRQPSSQILVFRSICILLSELCERLAYYSIDANLILLFINQLNIHKGTANTLALFWKGCVYVSPLLGGWLADSYWGRYKTVIIGVVVYILSMVALAVGVVPTVLASNSWLIFTALFVVALATGAIKSNVVTFGADQFTDVEDATALKQTFFNWFYFSINVGAMIAYTAVAFIQQSISFTIGLAVPAGVMFLSAVFFVAGSKWYVKLPPAGSILGQGLSIIYYAIRAPASSKTESFIEGARTAVHTDGSRRFSDNAVEDMKDFFRVIPILSFFIVFWCLYAQMGSVFFTQGTVMNLTLGTLEVPVTSLHVFNTAGILILVPIFERGLYPLLRKYNVRFTMIRRIGAGMLLATLGILYAGCLEVYRLDLYRRGYVILQTIGDKQVLAVDLSVMAQAPGFFLIGAGEVLASITGLEFAYDQSPANMKSMVIAVFYLTSALGNYLGSAIVAVTNAVTQPAWISDNLNASRMDLYFFLLAGIGFANFFLYCCVVLGFKARPSSANPPSDDETSVSKSVRQQDENVSLSQG